MKSAFQPALQVSEGIGCNSGTAPSSLQSLSSTTHLGEEAVSCNSSKAEEGFIAKRRPGSFESCREASNYADRTVLPLEGGRSWSCSEGTLGLGTDDPFFHSQRSRGSKKSLNRNSADSFDVLRQTSRQAQSNEPQKRKWQALKKERVHLNDLPDESDLLEGSETWGKNPITRKMSDQIQLKTEKVDMAVGPLQRSQSMKCPTGRKSSNASRNRTSRYIGVGSSNRKNQWQARILVHGKVTHLGYYRSEEEAAMVYDRVAVSLNGPEANTNFPATDYTQAGSGGEFIGMGREDLQRALGVKPMDKSSRFRGVSRKKGKWEAKVMVNRKWAYRALFDSEDEAAHAYDAAVRRLKPREASSFVNFGMEEATKKRPQLDVAPALRSKSQRLGRPKMARGQLKRQPRSFPDILVLDEAHIPPACTDLEPPSTPPHKTSLQAPVSPISGNTRATVASNIMSSSLFGDLSSGSSFGADTLPLAMQSSTNSPISKCNSLGQLSVTMPPPNALNLPDPNSIGVPPPDNLPFPELVKTPFSSAAGPESMMQRHNSGGVNQMGPMHNLSQASSLHSSLTLPEIPLPILEPTAVLPQENLGMGMESYFASTPLSQTLGQTLAQSQQTHRQELQQEFNPPQLTNNPFQEASKLRSPIPAVPASPLKHAGSGPFPLPPHPRTGILKKLKSMPESEFSKIAQQTLAQPFGQSALPGSIPRTSSDGLLRSQHQSMEGNHLAGMQAGLLSSRSGDLYSMQQQTGHLTQQLSSSSCNGDPRNAVLMGRPSVQFMLPNDASAELEGPEQGHHCDLASEVAPLGGHITAATLQDLPSLPFLPEVDAVKGERRGPLHRSMSALPSIPLLMEERPTSVFRDVQHETCLDALSAHMCNPGEPEGHEGIGENATDLLDGLLRENVDPANPAGVQIGGEYLHAYDALDLAGDAYILGQT